MAHAIRKGPTFPIHCREISRTCFSFSRHLVGATLSQDSASQGTIWVLSSANATSVSAMRSLPRD